MAKKLNSGNFSTEQLNQLVARIERLEEEKKALADDIKEVYAEAKAHGFDIKILRQVIRLRKPDFSRPAPAPVLAAMQGCDAIISAVGD